MKSYFCLANFVFMKILKALCSQNINGREIECGFLCVYDVISSIYCRRLFDVLGPRLFLWGGAFFFWSSYFSCQIHINKLLSLVRTSTSLPWTTLGFINILNLGYVFFSLHWLSPSVPAQTFIFVPFELQWDDYLLRVGLKLAVCFFSQQV